MNSIKTELKELAKELKYPFGRPEDRTLTKRELMALNNVLRAALERLWMGKYYPKTPDYSSHFSQEIGLVPRKLLKESINVCREVLAVNVETNNNNGNKVVLSSIRDQVEDAFSLTVEEIKQKEKDAKEKKKKARKKSFLAIS